ncbi:MAG: hypothetical protein JSV87_02310 [Candidatus Bathyarchaeota archaeon]|nr:MAG: hypothetical protein JSV87_02310 [Candidatus Bathyarchaeota archaeon]
MKNLSLSSKHIETQPARNITAATPQGNNPAGLLKISKKVLTNHRASEKDRGGKGMKLLPQ